MSDITDTLAPNSDQLDAVDLAGGPRTFTVASVNVTKSDQPVSIQLVEFPRVWRPGKNMRRVLAALWGADSSQWTGRRVTLYCDKTVRFGGEVVGGTRISHMSHIGGKEQTATVIPTRGKSAQWKVKPLEDIPTEADVNAAVDQAVLRDWWVHEHLRPAIQARVDHLKARETAAAIAAEQQGGGEDA